MPISLSTYREKRKALDIDLGDGDSLHIEYRPGVYTSAFEAEMNEGQKSGDRDALGRGVVTVIGDWDLFEDAKQTKKVPITIEAVREIPMPVLIGMFEAINEDMRPKQKTGGSFSDG